MSRLKSIFELPLFALLPRRCAYCGKIVAADVLACEECEKSLPRISGDVCEKCGREKSACTCMKAEKFYETVIAPFYFEGNVRRGLHAFKFRNGKINGEAYAIEMKKTLELRYGGTKFDMIVPVPMTAKSKRERGYDQVLTLAEELSRLMDIPCRTDILSKIYSTDKQHGLGYIYRKGNLAGVFDVSDSENVKDKTILLCDDISTSGETLDECAKMLWLSGAGKIYCITAALTKGKKKNK